jgi:hypothetical protein
MHCNVTAHPTAAWTLQQLHEGIPSDHSYRFLIHDRDAIFSAEVDQHLKSFGLRVLRPPARAPKANAYCERLVGSVRRECLDFMIPLGEKHLRRILSEWVTHYNQGRPHLSLGPGIPERAAVLPPLQHHDKHSFPQDCKVAARTVLGGLHHEYRWEGSPREGQEEFRRRCTLIASPQFLVAVRAGLQMPFVCNERNEFGEELVGSYLYQVHLHHEPEFHDYDRPCQATMHT